MTECHNCGTIVCNRCGDIPEEWKTVEFVPNGFDDWDTHPVIEMELCAECYDSDVIHQIGTTVRESNWKSDDNPEGKSQ